MGRRLVLTVHLHDRFHGMTGGGPEWPPAPARVFQALVAGSARGGSLPAGLEGALEWLEQLEAPVVAVPPASLGKPVALFVPNNDADSLRDPTDVGSIRTKKIVHPRIPEPGPILYAWTIDDADDAKAARIADAAADVYQLGRGVDMAWASGEIVSDAAFEEQLREYRGDVRVPHPGGREHMLACPARGSLRSLVERYAAPRLRSQQDGGRVTTYFANAPKPFFVGVGYAPVVRRLLLDLRRVTDPDRAFVVRTSEVASFVECVRDAAAGKLREALPRDVAAVERCLVGRKADGRDSGPISQRIRIVPLPSIGHEYADRGVRRLLVEIPSAAPLRGDDAEWAFAGLVLTDRANGGAEHRLLLVPAGERGMLDHYQRTSRTWRSITAVALPESAKRRRIEPSRIREERKGAAERAAEERAAIVAVHAALRHAEVRVRTSSVRVQREPFEARGLRAEAFGRPPRFPKERLWHVEVTLERAIEGPLVLGDGRFFGLGVMAPVHECRAVHCLQIVDGIIGHPDPIGLARALRRAVMARVQGLDRRRALGPFFSGHDDDGTPVRAARSAHLACHFDPERRCFVVIAPHVLDRREPTLDERGELARLDAALDEITVVRAGGAGLLVVQRGSAAAADQLLRASRIWQSLTSYVVTRHRRGASPETVLREDLERECARCGLPTPTVDVLTYVGVRQRGLSGQVRLTFATAVRGPIALGRTRHLGGGLFVRM